MKVRESFQARVFLRFVWRVEVELAGYEPTDRLLILVDERSLVAQAGMAGLERGLAGRM